MRFSKCIVSASIFAMIISLLVVSGQFAAYGETSKQEQAKAVPIGASGSAIPDAATREAKKGNVDSGSLKIEINKEEIVADSKTPVVLKLTLKNSTKDVLIINECNPQEEYTLSVLDVNDKELKPNSIVTCRYCYVYSELQPGKEIVSEYPLSNIYDFSKPGKYRITAVRYVYRRNDNEDIVVSDTVVLNIKSVKTGVEPTQSSNTPQ